MENSILMQITVGGIQRIMYLSSKIEIGLRMPGAKKIIFR
jgi:hypothetical protein